MECILDVRIMPRVHQDRCRPETYIPNEQPDVDGHNVAGYMLLFWDTC